MCIINIQQYEKQEMRAWSMKQSFLLVFMDPIYQYSMRSQDEVNTVTSGL